MSSTSPQTLANQNVLVVDTDPAVRASLQFALEVEGFVVRTYGTGEELLEEHALPEKACLIADFSLPKMNGLELVAALRDRGIDFPAVLLATNPPKRVRQQTLTAGMTLVEKPLLGNNLSEVVRAALAEG